MLFQLVVTYSSYTFSHIFFLISKPYELLCLICYTIILILHPMHSVFCFWCPPWWGWVINGSWWYFYWSSMTNIFVYHLWLIQLILVRWDICSVIMNEKDLIHQCMNGLHWSITMADLSTTLSIWLTGKRQFLETLIKVLGGNRDSVWIMVMFTDCRSAEWHMLLVHRSQHELISFYRVRS